MWCPSIDESSHTCASTFAKSSSFLREVESPWKSMPYSEAKSWQIPANSSDNYTCWLNVVGKRPGQKMEILESSVRLAFRTITRFSLSSTFIHALLIFTGPEKSRQAYGFLSVRAVMFWDREKHEWWNCFMLEFVQFRCRHNRSKCHRWTVNSRSLTYLPILCSFR